MLQRYRWLDHRRNLKQISIKVTVLIFYFQLHNSFITKHTIQLEMEYSIWTFYLYQDPQVGTILACCHETPLRLYHWQYVYDQSCWKYFLELKNRKVHWSVRNNCTRVSINSVTCIYFLIIIHHILLKDWLFSGHKHSSEIFSH